MFTVDNFYKSKEWINLIEILKLERVDNDGILYCEHCKQPIIKKYDCIGHHKEELTETNVNNYNVSLNKDNIQLIHFKCHNKIHERFGFLKQRVYIVYGSPCSNKNDWVNSVAYQDDLIIDIDKIWQCICNSSLTNKPNRIKSNVFGVRDCLIDQVKCRVGMWRQAFIIGGYPLTSDRERLANLLGAGLIYIDSTKEECLSKATNDELKSYVNEWWDTYTPPY